MTEQNEQLPDTEIPENAIEITEQDKEDLFTTLKELLKLAGASQEELDKCLTMDELAELSDRIQASLTESNEEALDMSDLDTLVEKMEIEQQISENDINLAMEAFLGANEISSILENNPLALLHPDNIAKLNDYVNRLNQTIKDTKDRTFKEVRESQMPQRFKDDMLKEMRKSIKPIEEEVIQMGKLLEELQKTSEAINNAKVIDAEN